jgi:outer membrane protein assembly factor BamB
MPRMLVSAGFVCLAVAAIAADWPQFRGPRGDGTAVATGLATTWGGFDDFTWQAEIPGRGWSSPVVVGDRIWLTSAESTALPTADREKKLAAGLYRDFAQQFQAHSSVTLYATEVNADTGEVLRTVELFEAKDPPPIHATNTYASPTPIADGGRLYCHFGSLGTCCLDTASGQVVWQVKHAVDEITGPASSPALWQDKLIVPCDGATEQYVLALDKLTGQVAWKTPRPKIDAADPKHRRGFSTPLVIEHAGRVQVVVPGARWVVSYSPADGKELWRVNMGDYHAPVARPVFHDGLVYVCTGFTKAQLLAIRADGTGDVTETHVAWRYGKQVPDVSSPVVAEDGIYFVSMLGVLTSLDAATGELRWQHRLSGNFTASPIFAAGKLYFTSEEGTTTVLTPGSTFQKLAENKHIGQTKASLAIADQSLVIRADRTLYCVGGSAK